MWRPRSFGGHPGNRHVRELNPQPFGKCTAYRRQVVIVTATPPVRLEAASGARGKGSILGLGACWLPYLITGMSSSHWIAMLTCVYATGRPLIRRRPPSLFSHLPEASLA